MKEHLGSSPVSGEVSSLPAAALRLAGEVGVASLAIGLVTAICFLAHLNYLIPSFLYLLIVVFLSLRTGYVASVIVSLIAAACFEYFFIPPVLEWRISDPEDVFALGAYLVTSLVITRLAASERNHTRIAEASRNAVARLYEAASQLLSLNSEVAAGTQALRIFRERFGMNAACLFDATTSTLQVDGESTHGLTEETRRAVELARDYRDAGGWLHVRCLYVEGKLAGAVGFEGRFEDETALGPLFALAATAFDRAVSFRTASMAAAAAQAEMLRSAILDAFAHEFKTPQAVIMAAAGSLRETGGLRAEQMEMADVIESEVWRMTRLTTRLLRMARIDRDEVRPNMELTSLESLLHHLVRQYRGSGAGSCEISVKIARHAPNVLIDPELMNLAFVQLLDNACKYSTPGTPISVEVGSGDEYADIFVINEGGFIREDERERVFERFYRGVETESTASGAGLGLYVARKIARAHGGDLDLQQDKAGEREDYVPDAAAGGTGARGDAYMTAMTANQEGPGANERPLRVLVVDDEAAMRRGINVCLTAKGYAVDEARCGEEALGSYHDRQPDLVLLDINMPGMSGIEVCRRIRSSDTKTGIVMVTVLDAEEATIEALEAGADDYIRKPFRVGEMLARLAALARRTRAHEVAEVPLIVAGELELDLKHRVLRKDGEEVHLSPIEFSLLKYLMQNPNVPVHHTKLLRAVWGLEYGQELEYLRTYIRLIRKKIEKDPAKPEYIITEPWLGYRFRDPLAAPAVGPAQLKRTRVATPELVGDAV